MSEQNINANPQTLIQFPPVPLVSGNAIAAVDGTVQRVVAVSATITLANGDIKDIPLEYRFGGWWVSAKDLVAG